MRMRREDDPMNTSTQLHRQIWDLIPWIVNGSASATERQAVEDHLRQCADCRDEYAFQSRLHAGIATETMDVPDAGGAQAQAGLRRLLARIDLENDAARSGRVDSGEPRKRRLLDRMLIAAVLVQGIGLALLVPLLLQRGDTSARYQTLTSAPVHASQAVIRLVPAPTLTLAELQAMLAAEELRIVESNTGGSIYGLAFDSDTTADTARAVERLRRYPGILLAEPIGRAAPR